MDHDLNDDLSLDSGSKEDDFYKAVKGKKIKKRKQINQEKREFFK